MSFEPNSLNLLITERGRAWLEQFAESDRPLVRQLAEMLSLVSIQEFERALQQAILKYSGENEGPIALYAVREAPRGSTLRFRNGGDGLDSVSSGSDVGSEARVAHILRQLSRTQQSQFIRQPSIESLLQLRARHIVIVDDLIGSGERTKSYLDQLWNDPTIKSWWSYKKIQFTVIAYAGTTEGVRNVRRHACSPEVRVHRYCPTLDGSPWPREQRRAVRRLCTSYAMLYALKGWALGFGRSASLMIFEHGCPNNVPNIFWADSKDSTKAWRPLFPGRASTGEVASVFPAELASRTPISVLLAAGQKRVAKVLPAVLGRPLTKESIIILALLGRGINRVEALAHAAHLEVRECQAILEACLEAGLMSPRRRLTEAGFKELSGLISAAQPRTIRVLDLGEDCYYPCSLRGRTDG